jgi:adenosylmethionine-8-amino-7-oxononanoate aminotransferase
MATTYKNYIGGDWVPAASGRTFEDLNPANREEVLGLFPRSDASDVERAVAAARERGLLLYSSTGCVDGTEGDLVMLGPPLVVTDAEVDEMADLTAAAVEATVPA